MSHREHPVWEEELMPYVDGQLDAAKASAIAEHLETARTALPPSPMREECRSR